MDDSEDTYTDVEVDNSETQSDVDVTEFDDEENIERDHSYKAGHITIEIVPPNQRITNDVITLGEATAICGMRISEIANNASAPLYAKTDAFRDTYAKIVEQEFFSKSLPNKIRRQIGTNHDGTVVYVEEWRLDELIIPDNIAPI